MKNLAYETIFGRKYTHEESLKAMISGSLSDIIREENNISEKDFAKYDQIIKQTDEIITDDVFEFINDMYNNGKRVKYIAEHIYDTYINKTDSLNQDSILNFGSFIDNKLL